MDFVKMEGLGNDFVVVDGPIDVTPDQVRRWCDRRRGIGGDGVLEVTPIDPLRVRMRYWNADGGAAEMCGNGLRCVAVLAKDRGWVESPAFVVDSPVGRRPVEVRADGTVRALLGTARADGEGPTTLHGVELHRVTVGNPHAVVFVDDLDRASVAELGPRIEHDDTFPDGANVEFATVTDTESITVRVWERGVGETLACGTGAAATVLAAHRAGMSGSRAVVHLPGGPLVVELHEGDAWIEGPANVVFTGTID